MIEWCAYCQRFVGERQPFDRLALSHGMCDDCRRRGVISDPRAVEAARPAADFFRDILRRARAGQDVGATELLDRAAALSIRPLDLLVGMVQPLLYELGELWSRGEVSVAIEHRFTATVESLLAVVLAGVPVPPPVPGGVLLVNADGNAHTVGARIVELTLRDAGVPVTAILPGLPATEVFALARSLRPAAIAVSVSLLPQMRSVRELVALLRDLDPGECPRVVVGGLPVKAGLLPTPDLGIELLRDPTDLVALAAA